MKGIPILLRDKESTGDKERRAGLPANLPADDHKQKGPADYSVGPSKNGIGAERLLPSPGRGKGVGRKTRQLPFEVYGRRSRL